jgi:hypothetical protein
MLTEHPTDDFLRAGWLDRHAGNWLLLVVAVALGIGVGAAAGITPSLGIVAVGASVVGLLVLRRPSFGGYLLVALVPVVSGFRRGFPVSELRLAELLILYIGSLILFTANRWQAMRWTAVDWLLLAWAAAWSVVGAVNTIGLHQTLDIRTVEGLIGPFQFVVLYRSVLTALPLHDQRRRAIRLFLWASVPVSLLALAQQFRIEPVQRAIEDITGGDVFNTYAYNYFQRATGPFPHWTPLAGYLTIVLLVGFALLLEGRGPLSKRELIVILLLASCGMVLTAELSATGGTIVGVLILGVWYRRLAQAARTLVAASISLVFFFGSYINSRLDTQFGTSAGSSRKSFVPQTIHFRIEVWTQQYFPAIGQRPLTGWGLNLPGTIRWPFTESQYVTLLMEGGVIVLLAYLALMWALYLRGRSVGSRSVPTDFPENRALGRSLTVIVVVLAAMNVVFPYFTAGGLPEPFWVVAGLVAAGMRKLDPHGNTRDRLAAVANR